MKVLTVVGARPQFVKAFAVSRALRREHEEVLLHTGQHYDAEMTDVFFEELGIPEPDVNLGVGSSSHAAQTAGMMTGIETAVETEAPDVVLTYGDTNSTLAGALVAAKTVPLLGHVEAGMRSFNWAMPEEVNRVLTDHASDLLFASSEGAVEHLRREGITDGVFFTGDVMYDTLLWARERAESSSTILDDLGVVPGEYYLATVHRPRNTEDSERLGAILDAFDAAPLPVVFPAHPRTVVRLREFGMLEGARDVTVFTEPVGYLDIVRLLDGARAVATDSGGLQKEAFFLDTPCVTLREETEWTETVESGWNVLAGADRERITAGLRRAPPREQPPSPYGNGNAAITVVRALESKTE